MSVKFVYFYYQVTVMSTHWEKWVCTVLILYLVVHNSSQAHYANMYIIPLVGWMRFSVNLAPQSCYSVDSENEMSDHLCDHYSTGFFHDCIF